MEISWPGQGAGEEICGKATTLEGSVWSRLEKQGRSKGRSTVGICGGRSEFNEATQLRQLRLHISGTEDRGGDIRTGSKMGDTFREEREREREERRGEGREEPAGCLLLLGRCFRAGVLSLRNAGPGRMAGGRPAPLSAGRAHMLMRA